MTLSTIRRSPVGDLVHVDGAQAASTQEKFQPAPQAMDDVGCGIFGAQRQHEDRPGFGAGAPGSHVQTLLDDL
jgi:hypothetical protein